MKQTRLVEKTMSNGTFRYSMEKKTWYGWRTIPFCHYGVTLKHHYDKGVVDRALACYNDEYLHVVAKREIG